MKKLIGFIALCASFYTNATLISLSFDKSVYQQNEQVQGQIIAYDLSYTLGGFAGEVIFDDSLLTLNDWQFGNGFDDGLGSYSFADDTIAGKLVLEDYADLFADETVIANNQGTGFVLASFTFTPMALGLHNVNIANGFELISFDNINLERFDSFSSSFSVVAVDEPGFVFIIMLLIVGLVTRTRDC